MRVRFYQTRLFRLMFLGMCLLFAAGMMRSVFIIWQKQGIVSEREAVLRAEEAKRARLLNELREATSAAFIEREARDKLGLVKDGETVVIMDKTKPASESGEGFRSQSSWKQWWGLFF